MRSLTVAAQQAINNTEKEKALVTAALVARQLQVLLLCCALLCRWQIPLKSKTKHLFYFIMENWNFGDREGFRWGMPQEESFRLLSRRKNVYITTMDRVQYEKAKELDYFKAFFPHTIEIRDLEREEKVELLKCAAKEYGFAFDAKSFRNSDILKLPYPTLQTQLYSVIQNQLADADNNMISAEDIQAVFAESDMSALLGTARVQRRIGFAG